MSIWGLCKLFAVPAAIKSDTTKLGPECSELIGLLFKEILNCGKQPYQNAFKPSKCRHALNLMREFRVHGLGSFLMKIQDLVFRVYGFRI